MLYRCLLFPTPCVGADVSKYYVVTPLVPYKLGDENRRAGLGVRGRSVGVGSVGGAVRTSLRVASMRKLRSHGVDLLRCIVLSFARS